MEDRIAVIGRQFLQGLPITKIDFDVRIYDCYRQCNTSKLFVYLQDIFKNLDWDFQKKLLKSTILHNYNVSWPLKVCQKQNCTFVQVCYSCQFSF